MEYMRTHIPILAATLAVCATGLVACDNTADDSTPSSFTTVEPPANNARADGSVPISKEDYSRRVAKTKVTCSSPDFETTNDVGNKAAVQLVTSSIHATKWGTDEVRLEFYPHRPHAAHDNEVDPVTMEVVNREGHTYRLNYRGARDFDAEVSTPQGFHADVTDTLRFAAGRDDTALLLPLVAGFVSLDAPLETITVSLGDKEKATCVPVDGAEVTPVGELDVRPDMVRSV